MTDALPAATAYLAARPVVYERRRRTSHYVTMRDGVRLALDLTLPEGAPGPLPAIVRQTRYFRSLEPTPLGRWLGEARVDPVNGRMRSFFVGRGYAWLDVDVRGSGASTGVWHSPWSPLEVEDGRDLLDWIAAQPWSNGKVGTTGNSYDGTAAELMATLGHPALRACAPRCSLYDVYTDIAFPGGLRLEWFTAAWTRANQALDAGHPETMVAGAIAAARPWLTDGVPRRALEGALRLIFRRVRAVDGDRATIAAAIAERGANLDVAAAARTVEFRDDAQATSAGPATADAFSPSSYLARARAHAVPTFSLSGWFDAAYPHASIKRHLSLADPRNHLVLGPWNHGVSQQVSPHAASRTPAFHLDAELLRFFDEHLCDRTTGFAAEPAVRYYVMGAEAWRSAPTWPPPEAAPRALYLAGTRTLAWDAPPAGRDELRHDPSTGSGPRSRWRTLVSPFVVADYPDRAARDRQLLVYRSAPLAEPLELAGHPILELELVASAADGAVFAYLEEETATAVHYVTEGALRLRHRATDDAAPLYRSAVPYRSFTRAAARPMPIGTPVPVGFDLLPVAYRFARGSRIRLALATADADHFAAVRDAGSLAIVRGASRLVLPALPAAQ